MHILNISHRYYPAIGGAESYIKEMSERLVKDGHSVTVFTTDAWDLEHFWKPYKKRIRIYKEIYHGVRIERFRVVRFPCHFLAMRILYKIPFLFSRCLFSLPSPLVPGMWKRLFVKNHDGFDVVHVTAFPFNGLMYMAFLFARRNNIPLVITPFLHLGETENDKVRRYYTRQFQIRILKECDRIIVQTSIEADYLGRMGIRDDKIHMCGQGVNIEDVQGGDRERFRKKFNIKEGKIVFHVAAKSYDKGTVHLLEAMKLVWDKDRDIKLVLAGPEMDGFRRYFSKQKIEVKDKCLILDYVISEDKKDLFSAGDVFALPSRTDSFGIVFLEAWLNKKPVIGADAGGIPEVIRHSYDGYLIKFGDIEQLAHSIKKLLYDKTLAHEMGARGYEKVMNGLTWDERYSKFKEILLG